MCAALAREGAAHHTDRVLRLVLARETCVRRQLAIVQAMTNQGTGIAETSERRRTSLPWDAINFALMTRA